MTHHPSFGSALKWDPAGGAAYVALGQVKDIAGPALVRGDVDVSDHDSTLGYREFLPGLVDGGAITFILGFDPNNSAHDQSATGLLGNMELDGCTLATFEYTLSTCTGTAVWTFAGYVNAFTSNAPVEGELTANVGIKVSSKPTLTVT